MRVPVTVLLLNQSGHHNRTEQEGVRSNMEKVTMRNPYHSVLQAFGIDPLHFSVVPHESSLGLINTTYFVINTGDAKEGDNKDGDEEDGHEKDGDKKDGAVRDGDDTSSLDQGTEVNKSAVASAVSLSAGIGATSTRVNKSSGASTDSSTTPVYVLQLFNDRVFEPNIVEANILACTAKLQASTSSSSAAAATPASSRTRAHVTYLSYLTTTDHRHFHIDEDGRYYRMMKYIPGTTHYNTQPYPNTVIC